MPHINAQRVGPEAHEVDGLYAKLIVNDPEPWWRKVGLGDEYSSSLEQYSQAIVVSGNKASRWHALPDKTTKHAVIVELVAELASVELKIGDGDEESRTW
ncbi:uncharacterized protein F5Z01DRAFT_674966 [Emericellopsis atlantica]|uniref:Uncharacterized protein n=1 Tax=Emericellopsis atlantica TaxID=2614577 RepID=A0A9P8CNY3_9HYPO|nr:uncharacterized protein F5Z01DRAFT_674966 [Emericellopsis atlantica]KAG9253560.1 hypothetical protein F5Z01DRAFT_674966 [Emericellopsis atlantica]